MTTYYKSKLDRGRNILLTLLFSIFALEILGLLAFYFNNRDSKSPAFHAVLMTLPRWAFTIFLSYFTYRGRRLARNILALMLFTSLLYITYTLPDIVNLPTPMLAFMTFVITVELIALISLFISRDLRHFFDYQREKEISKNGRPNKKSNTSYKYEFAISFAGEDRPAARKLSDMLIENGVRVFYDKDEGANLLATDLYLELQKKYKNDAKYCVILVSKNYIKKKWTRHELHNALARSLNQSGGYIIPVLIDETVVPGINETIGFYDLRKGSIRDLARQLTIKALNSPEDHEIYGPASSD